LCLGDQPAGASELAAALRDAGAVRVLAAGTPPRDAGVDMHLKAGVDLPAVLTDLLDTIGAV
ncbi:MAG: hypothetical protein M3419_05340, partial [Actinomycetota bacterium]|nr:hypothetical protein [Actinomycetota bacterium]